MRNLLLQLENLLRERVDLRVLFVDLFANASSCGALDGFNGSGETFGPKLTEAV